MSVVSCDELFLDRGTDQDFTYRKYTRTWRVITNNWQDGPAQVIAHPSIPRAYDVYATPTETDLGAYCVSVKAKPENGQPNFWIVTAEYSSGDLLEKATPGGGDPQQSPQQQPDPLLRPAIITFSSSRYQKPIWKDLDGNPILNSAGERFNPPVTIDDSRPHITITKFFDTFDMAVAIQYQDAVNSDDWLGAPPGLVKINQLGARQVYENKQLYWEVNGEFECRREGWRLKPLNQGSYYLDGAGKHIRFKDKDGHPLPSGLLDKDGLALGNPALYPPTYQDFRGYEFLPFADLNLP